MIYYFSLVNKNIKDFVSPSGECVILINNKGCNDRFECTFIRKNDTQTIYTIDLEYTDYNKYVTNDHNILLMTWACNDNGLPKFAIAQLHMRDDFGGNIEEPCHYYHFAVDLKEKLKLTEGKHEPVKSIKIFDILNNNGVTIEFSLFDEKMMFRPDGTIYYVYSVKIPDKYLESFYLERNSFTKLLYLSDTVTNKYGDFIAVNMYRSINGPKGLKDSMGLEERSTSLKNFWQPEAKPEWSWDIKPLSMKPVDPECNITIGIPKDFIPPYSVADSKINRLEILKEMSMFESDKRVRIPEIKEVIFNKPATIVYWKDGTKTTVKCGNDEASFDREKAVGMCFLKKMFKPSIKSHWLDVINDAIKAADDKIAQVEADKAEKARIKAENIAKAEEARRKKAEKEAEKKAAANKIEEIQKKVNEPLEEMPKKNERKELFETIQKESNKVVLNKNGGVKIDQELFLECVKENLTIDEIAEMNSWDKAAVARMYYKVTGKRPEKKNNTYSELDELFEKGVSVDAAARRTGFSKNIVAMRYAKLQNKKN